MSRAASQRAAMRRLHDLLVENPSADTLQRAVVEEACRLTDAAGAALCYLTEENTFLDYVAAAGELADQIVGLRVRVADSLAEQVLRKGHSILIESSTNHQMGSLFQDTDDESQRFTPPPYALFNARAAALVPVRHQKRIMGVLAVLHRRDSLPLSQTSLDQEDIDILETLAGFLSIARSMERANYLAQEKSREIIVFHDAIRTISRSLNLQEVVDNVLDIVCKHMEHYAAALFLLNDEKTHLFIASERNLTPEESERQLSVENSLVSQVLQEGRSFLVSDVEAEPEFEDISDPPRALSALLAPVRNGDEVRGLIFITSLQRHAYREDDLQLLVALGMQAGIAIENAELYEDARRQAEEASALYTLSQQVNATLDVETMLEHVADSVTELFQVDRLAMLLYDEEKGRLVPRLIRHPQPEELQRYRPRPGEGIAGWVFEWQTPQAVADVAADQRNRTAPLHTLDIASMLCVPMHAHDKVIGVISAMSSKRRLFTVGEMELLYTIANQVASNVLNATLYKEAKEKSREMRRYFKRVSHAVGALFEHQNLPQWLADLCVEMLRADRCTIYQLEGEELHLLAAARFRSGTIPLQRIPLGHGLAGWIAKRSQTLVVPQLAEEERAQTYSWLQKDHLASYLGIPLKHNHRIVGVVEVFAQEPGRFETEEAQLLTAFLRRTPLVEKMHSGPVEVLSP